MNSRMIVPSPPGQANCSRGTDGLEVIPPALLCLNGLSALGYETS